MTTKPKAPLWQRIVVPIIAAVLIVVWVQWGNKAFANEPEPEPLFTSSSLPVIHVDPDIWWDEMEAIRVASKYRDRRLGHSERHGYGTRIVNIMDAWRKNTGSQIQRWWTRDFHRNECLFHHQVSWTGLPGVGALGGGFCAAFGDAPSVRRINREMTHIKIVCGGAAILGGFGGSRSGTPGVVVGMGLGGAGCLYSRYSERFVNWLP
jgi:hypothetical protein